VHDKTRPAAGDHGPVANAVGFGEDLLKESPRTTQVKRANSDPAREPLREQQIQRALCQHLDTRGVSGLVWFAVPNGNKLGGKISAKGIAIQGSINKGIGVKAGTADLIFLHDSKFFALELKVGKNRPTEKQLEFIDRVNAAGGYACWCSGLDAALQILKNWRLLRGRAS
jgi:hypothetical protein